MIPIFRPDFDRRELRAMLPAGAGRAEFESALAEWVGARHAIAFAYARSGLVAALGALGLSGAEVILPAYTCDVVAEAVVVCGNRPVFVDIDLEDYNMDLGAMKGALGPRTRAIVATHIYGYPIDIAGIRALAGDERVLIVEDAAMRGPIHLARDAAGRGDITIFSFNLGKHLYALGGGVVVTDREDLYEKIRGYRDREMGDLPWQMEAERLGRLLTAYLMLNESLFGGWARISRTRVARKLQRTLRLTSGAMPRDYAAAFSGFQARVGLTQLRKLDSILARGRAVADLYDRLLRDLPGIKLPPAKGDAVCAPYTVRVERRGELGFRRRMVAQGIAVGVAFDYVLPHKEAYRQYASGPYPRAEQAAREVANLPSYPGLSVAEVRSVAEAVRRALGGIESPATSQVAEVT